jgi:hypothetical protein
MTVRQIAADFPESEIVFRRYGEAPREAAKFGHLEPLAHFARRRGAALAEVLSELAAATGAPIDREGPFADRVHRPFILAALAITLTLGAGWGAWLLWQIGRTGDFAGAATGPIVAHGEAQLWGFMTLFIIGISLRTVLQAVARHADGQWACQGLWAAGLFGVVGGFLWFLRPESWPWLGVASAWALVLMAVGYWLIELMVVGPKYPATWSRAILAAGLWLVIWAGLTLVLRRTAGADGPQAYSGPQRMLLIELAVFGFAMNSIYGFGQMLLPGLLRLGSPHMPRLEVAHVLHNLGPIALCLTTARGWPGWVAAAGGALVAGGAVAYAAGMRAFVGKPRQSRRAEQGERRLDAYVPLAFFWLLASLALLAGGYVYQATSGAPLPHEFVGAVRHALTVGFMTTLILGVGQRLVPVLEHTVLAWPRLVTPILALIGLGNLLRVSTELAALRTTAFFGVMPLSAVCEWTALLLFAVNMVGTMGRRRQRLVGGRATRTTSAAAVLETRPWLEDRLIAAGYGYLARTRSVPPELSLGSLAESEGRTADELVALVNSALAEPPA